MLEEQSNLSQAPLTESEEAQPIPVKIKTAKNDEPIRVTDRRFWVHPNPLETEGDVSSSLKPSYVEELEKQLADSKKKLEEVLASYRISKAEAQEETRQAKERIQNEYNKRVTQARGAITGRFVEVLENMDRALAVSELTENFASLLEGVKLIRSQFSTAISDLGLQELPVMGELFNPEVAEAIQIQEVENESDDNKVLEVVSRGYTLDGTLIRPARVVVGKCRAPVSETAGQ